MEYRALMRSLPTGVSILAVADAQGNAVGLTVSAVTSVSLSPPILLVCIHQRARIRSLLGVGLPIAVNILASGQAELARRFASSAQDRFGGVEHTLRPNGYVMIAGAVAHIFCSVRDIVEVGDHSVVYGNVMGGESYDGRPLLFYDHVYSSPNGVRHGASR